MSDAVRARREAMPAGTDVGTHAATGADVDAGADVDVAAGADADAVDAAGVLSDTRDVVTIAG